VVQPFSYAATPSGYTLGETALKFQRNISPGRNQGAGDFRIREFGTRYRADERAERRAEEMVAKEIGSLAKPDDIRFTDTLPKTRSGKIMRRLLRELASSGEVKGDTTTLEDFGVIAKLKEQDEV
jgi:acetyl-CoA synthetase